MQPIVSAWATTARRPLVLPGQAGEQRAAAGDAPARPAGSASSSPSSCMTASVRPAGLGVRSSRSSRSSIHGTSISGSGVIAAPYPGASRRSAPAGQPRSGASGRQLQGSARVVGNSRSTKRSAVGWGSWLASPGRSLASMNTPSGPSGLGTIRSRPVTGMPMAPGRGDRRRRQVGVQHGGDVVDRAARVQVRGAADRQLARPRAARRRASGRRPRRCGPSRRRPGSTTRRPVADDRRRLWASTRSRTVCRPVPITAAGRRTAAATTSWSITTMRRSSPGDPLLDQHVGAERPGDVERGVELVVGRSRRR